MKILMVAPIWERVPPLKYGGIELVVSLLTEELVRRGHEVTLYATGDALTKAKLKYVYKSAVRNLMGSSEPALIQAARAFELADEHDVVHNHLGHFGVAFTPFIKTPVLTTLHGIFTPSNREYYKAFNKFGYYNAISRSQRDDMKSLNYAGVVYNAIDIGSYEYREKKKDHFVFISRISELKGAHLAVKLARKAGVKLVLAGKIDKGRDTEYFEKKILPFVDGDQIKYAGEVSEEKKRRLFRDAKAFLFPLQWPEPFGLVMAEAMACGTPVISMPYGSVPEVVRSGTTGIIASDEAGLLKAIRDIDTIDPANCRKRAETLFSVGRMTDDYLALFEKIIAKQKGRQRS